MSELVIVLLHWVYCVPGHVWARLQSRSEESSGMLLECCCSLTKMRKEKNDITLLHYRPRVHVSVHLQRGNLQIFAKGGMKSELVYSCLVALLHWRLNQVTCEFICRGNLQRPPEIGKGKNDVWKGHCRAGLLVKCQPTCTAGRRGKSAKIGGMLLECYVLTHLAHGNFPFRMEICNLKINNSAAQKTHDCSFWCPM